MRRIVFSISFFRQVLPVQLVFTSTKSRRKFYTQVERQSFHTASTRSGHSSQCARHLGSSGPSSTRTFGSHPWMSGLGYVALGSDSTKVRFATAKLRLTFCLS